MKFTTPIWHPNVYTNGDVCISILHEPGEDAFNPQEKLIALLENVPVRCTRHLKLTASFLREQEKASMRWNPIHTVETIVISVVSMLSDPTDESPANIDAAVRIPGLHGSVLFFRSD